MKSKELWWNKKWNKNRSSGSPCRTPKIACEERCKSNNKS